MEKPSSELAWVSGYHCKFHLKPYVKFSLRTSTISTLTRTVPWCEIGVAFSSTKRLFHFRFHVFIQIFPLSFSCQPPSDIWRNCYCKPTFSCSCSHTFVINIVNQSNTTCFVSFVHKQSTYSYKDIRKTNN